ncbi:XRE family transcriptional regulator [Methylobacterium sp. Leaf100]|uniref:helix-turn-helix domain-containing protein n=1 Tax=Methylobacterium sp. Leaf100 TaxID=1736252 RepID=UPI0009EBA851|nr:XRE family transcriptional regulator [Methylobacterium sp. Leaf100]
MSDVRLIKTDADYRWAMAEIDAYFHDEPILGSPDGHRFEVLLDLVARYERAEFPIRDADPVELLHFAIQDLGRSQKELSDILNSRSHASEVLKRKRPLTLEMIRKISAAWHLPIAALAAPYELAQA